MKVTFLVICVLVGLTVILPQRSSALNAGQMLPDLNYTTLSGQSVSHQSLRNKVVLVDFWASWCEPCADEMPVLERLHNRHRAAGLVVLGISQDEQQRNAERFATRVSVTFPLVHDQGHAIARRFAPARMPTSYIFDRRGVLRHVHQGFRAEDGPVIEREVAALVREVR